MHNDLKGCIETAKLARDGLLAGTMPVKEANSVAANNHIIIGAHALDLRERMFVAEVGSQVAAAQIADERAPEGGQLAAKVGADPQRKGRS